MKLPSKVCLAVIDDNEARLERENLFEIRIEQRANLRDSPDLRGKAVEAADRGDAFAGTQREEHFGYRRDQGDDSSWMVLWPLILRTS